MGKELAEMTLEELWELFPISLVAPDDRWPARYDEMESFLQTALRDHPVVRLSHVGSTAIRGIQAKNIIDILVEFSPDAPLEEAARALERNGFLRMSAAADRISLNKGYTKHGFADKVYHLHLRRAGDNDELYFRDYLNDHPQLAKEYESLKLRLREQHEHDRDAYTAAKTPFVRKWTAEARKQYANRYAPPHSEIPNFKSEKT